MAIIVTLGGMAPHGAAAAQAIRALGTLIVCTSVTHLVNRASAGDVSAVVLPALEGADHASLVEAAVELRRRHPILWILLFSGQAESEQRALPELASLSMRVVLVMASIGLLRSTLVRMLATSTAGMAPLEMELLFSPYAPRHVRRVFERLVANTHRAYLPSDLSSDLHVPGRTIRGRLARSGWPPPRELMSWCRLLHATFLLDLLEVPTKQAGAALGYPSAAALHVSIRRHFDLSTRSLIEHGGYAHALVSFEERLKSLGARRRDFEGG
ncbi:MAG: hypothetical protein ACREL3_01835 [Gemmatimonadales bacterium]